MNTIISAKILFDEVLNELGISELAADGCDGEPLQAMNHEHGWLSSWMLKADEIAATVINKRLFDVHYQKNEDSLSGHIPIDPEGSSLSTYDEFEVASPEEIPYSVSYLICKQAVVSTLDLGKELAVLRTNQNRYAAVNDSGIIAFPDSVLLHANHLRDLTSYIIFEQKLINARRRASELEM